MITPMSRVLFNRVFLRLLPHTSPTKPGGGIRCPFAPKNLPSARAATSSIMPPHARRGPSGPVLLPGTPIHGLDSLTPGGEYRLDRYSWYPPNPMAVFTSVYGGQNLE